MKNKKNKNWVYYILLGLCCLAFCVYKALGIFPSVFQFSYVDKVLDEVQAKYKGAFDAYFEANRPKVGF